MKPSAPVDKTLRRFALLAAFLLTSATMAACGGEQPSSEPNQENDGDDVTIEITHPTADAWENRERFRVRGTADGTSSIEVNGEPTSVSGGQWEVLLDFNEGPATVTATSGDTEASVDFFVDTSLPLLTLESPERGAVVDAADSEVVIIKGVASDEVSGLVAVSVNGSIIEEEEDGSFEVERPLEEGINVFTIVARDRAQNETTEMRAVLHGPLVHATDPINQAATMDITPGGLADLAEVIEAYATPARIMGFMEGGFGDSDLTVTDITWDELTIEIIPRNGHLEIEVHLTNLRVEGEYQSGDADPDPGYIDIAEMTVRLDVEMGVESDELIVNISNSEVDLEASDIDSDLTNDTNLLRALIRGAIVLVFEDFISDLVTENLYDSDVLSQEFEFLGRVIEIRLMLEDILITTNGVRVELGVAFPAEPHPDTADFPGALHRVISPNSTTSITSPFRLHSTRTALDRILHSVWQAGLFHQRIGGDDLDGIPLPFDLTADGLAGLLDQRIRDVHETDTPVEFRLRPLLPPVLEFEDNDDIMLEMGDFLIDFYLNPEGKEPTHILSVALYLEVVVEISLDEFEIRFEIDLDAEADIAAEPLFEFDRERTVNLITDLLEIIPALAANDLSVGALADFEWASIGDLVLEFNGQERDRITAGLTISPATDFIDEDEIEPAGGE